MVKKDCDYLFFHQNMVVCTPSGSGKTLIGLLAIANLLLQYPVNAVYLVPYKSLAQEKETEFNRFFEHSPVPISAQAITSDTPESVSIVDEHKILITTYEKCDSLLRNHHPVLHRTKIVIIDEIHELGFPGRGPRLEFLLVRLLNQLTMVQVLALSATIANFTDLTDWLSSLSRPFALVHSLHRPIPLEYRIQLYKNNNKISILRTLIQQTLKGEKEEKEEKSENERKVRFID